MTAAASPETITRHAERIIARHVPSADRSRCAGCGALFKSAADWPAHVASTLVREGLMEQAGIQTKQKEITP